MSRHLWYWLGLIISLIFIAPIAMLVWQGLDFSQGTDHWHHLLSTWLGEALINSLLLTVLSGLGAVILGTSLAWLTVAYRFPGSRALSWLLILPLALPPYVVTMLVTWWADSSGVLHLWFRGLGWVNRWVDIQNLPVLALIFSLVFMPYVFLLVRASFQRQGLRAFEAARALGLSPYQAFMKAALPIAKPSILAGAALVMMETLADYGASSLFSVPTLTQAIYRSWFNMGDWVLAAQLSIALITTIIFLLLWLQPSKQQQLGQKPSEQYKQPKGRCDAALMSLYGWGVFTLAFILPMIMLIWQSLTADTEAWNISRLSEWFSNSLILAAIAAVLASSIALMVSWQAYTHPNSKGHRWSLRILSIGYGIPGTALAVAILLTWQQLGFTAGIVALVFAYLVRFMSMAVQSTQAGLTQLSPRLLEAAQLHGYQRWQQHWRITIPLLSPHLLAASLMVAVEVLKELPATLMLRPFNFDTLAVITYQYAQDERVSEASGAALLIVIASLLGLFVVKWVEKRSSYT